MYLHAKRKLAGNLQPWDSVAPVHQNTLDDGTTANCWAERRQSKNGMQPMKTAGDLHGPDLIMGRANHQDQTPERSTFSAMARHCQGIAKQGG
jgi:hypothetical protein